MMFLAFSITSIGLGFVRYIGALFCNIIYGLVAKLFQLFMIVSQLNILSSDEIAPIYQRITLILTIVMVFYITFEFVKYVVQPDNMTDKEKGVGNIVTRIMIAIVLIAFVPRIFTIAYDLQNKLITNQVFSKIILGSKNIEFDTFGSAFSADMLGVFYGLNSEACGGSNYDSECQEAEQKVEENLRKLREDGEVTLIPGITGTKSMTVDGEKEDVALIRFDGLMAIIVGGVILYLIVLYTVDVGTRYAQLIFLQIMSPIAIIGYISPKKDGIFQKWLKQCITTYLDLFIRLSIIYFVLLIIDVLGDSFNSGSLFAGIEGVGGGYKTLTYIVLVLGLLVFANKAPKMIGELLPGGGAASIGYGLKGGDRVAPMAARAIGASLGGGLTLATSTRERFAKEKARRKKIKDDLLNNGKPTDKRTMRRALNADRRQERQANKDLKNKKNLLNEAHEKLISAENKLKMAKLNGMDEKSQEYLDLKKSADNARTHFENVKSHSAEASTTQRLKEAQDRLYTAKVTGAYDKMDKNQRAKLEDDVDKAHKQWLEESGYKEIERAQQQAADKLADSQNKSFGAPIGLQMAGAAATGLFTGMKVGAQATSLGDINKKITEASKQAKDKEKARIEWLESGGGATIDALITKKITEVKQKYGFQTETERIKLTIKELETEVKERESQIKMESNVKKAQDEAEKRAESKISNNEQFIYTLAEDNGKLTYKDMNNEKQTIETAIKDEDGNIIRQMTTSEINMLYQERANTAKVQSEAANTELTKAELEGRTTEEIQRIRTIAEAKAKESENAQRTAKQVFKALRDYSVTRTYKGNFTSNDKVDEVLVNQINAMKDAINTARNNAKTIQYLRSLVEDGKMTQALFDTFMNGDITDRDTYDAIQGLLTGHTGVLTLENNRLNETIRNINESAATAAANANASGSGSKK